MIKKVDINDNNFLKTKTYHLPFTTTYLLPLTSYLFKKKGQVMIEFAFCMIILFLMMYAIIMVFRWVGLDLGQRQQAHEAVLTTAVDPQYGQCAAWSQCCDPDSSSLCWDCPPCLDDRPVERGPLTQIDPYFYTPAKMNAVWSGD